MKKIVLLLCCFIVSLAVRAQISCSPSFLSFITPVHDTSAAAEIYVNTTMFGVDSPRFTVTAPRGYRVSFDGVTWDTAISTHIDTGITLGMTIYVEFLPVDSSHYSEALLISVENLPVKSFPLCGNDVCPYISYTAADSFFVFVNQYCSGPQITIATNYYIGPQNVINFYGDGSSDTTTLSEEIGGASGYAVFNHNYSLPGTYSLKTVFRNGTIPVDSQVYSFEYKYCRTIQAKYYYDANANGVYDAGIDNLIAVPVVTEVDSDGIPVDTISSTSGLYYLAYGSVGSVYTLRTISMSPVFMNSSPASGVINDTLSLNTYENTIHYFGVKCSGTTPEDLAVYDVIPVTGVNDQWGNLYLQNLGSCAAVDAVITEAMSPKYGSYYTHMGTGTVTGNVITWSVPGFSVTDGVKKLYHVADDFGGVTVPIGDTVLCHSKVTPYMGDCDTNNNSEVIVDTVRAGCDPNEMWGSPSFCVPQTTGTTPLQYTISFVNTGNGPAVNIYVLDTLSPNVDMSSLRIVMASNTMNIFYTKDAAGDNIVKFDFPNINLLDSSHHDSCSGALIFTINTKPDLALNATINNEAGIYFDVNPVVMTNKVMNLVGCPSSIGTLNEDKTVMLFPNPATQECRLQTTDARYTDCIISNTLGQVVMKQAITSNATTLDVSTLPAGVYFVTVKGDNVSIVKQMVKL